MLARLCESEFASQRSLRCFRSWINDRCQEIHKDEKDDLGNGVIENDSSSSVVTEMTVMESCGEATQDSKRICSENVSGRNSDFYCISCEFSLANLLSVYLCDYGKACSLVEEFKLGEYCLMQISRSVKNVFSHKL